MEVRRLRWPDFPLACCYISPQVFLSLSAAYKRANTDRFEWGNWAIISHAAQSFLCRCHPDVHMPLLEQIYVSAEKSLSFSDSIMLDSNSAGDSAVPSDFPGISLICASLIAECPALTLHLLSSHPYMGEETSPSRATAIKTLLATSNCLVRANATIRLSTGHKEHWIFRIDCPGSRYLKVTKDTVVEFRSGHDPAPERLFHSLIDMSMLTRPTLVRLSEFRSFAWILKTGMHVIILSLADVMSQEKEKMLSLFKNWVLSIEHTLTSKSIVVIRDIEKFGLDKTISSALLSFVSTLHESYSSSLRTFTTKGRIRMEMLDDVFNALNPADDLVFKNLLASLETRHGFLDFLSSCTLEDVFDFCYHVSYHTSGKGSDNLSTPSKDGNVDLIVSSYLENVSRIPSAGNVDCSWESVGGYESVKLEIRQAVEWPLIYPEAFKRLGLEPCNGILLHGPPGCSKTSLARVSGLFKCQITASQCGVKFLSFDGAELYSCFVGESERLIRDIFKKARASAPCILFFDELDALVGARSLGNNNSGASFASGSSGPSGKDVVQERILSTMLNEMDGIEPLAAGVLVMAATNRLDRIDAALLRPGRFDRIVHVPHPDDQTRKKIFQVYVRNLPVQEDSEELVSELVSLTSGFSGAECKQVCHEAAFCALRKNPDAHILSRSHFLEALKIVKR